MPEFGVSRRLVGKCLLPLLLAGLAMPAIAQPSADNPYDTERAEFAHLLALEDRAVELTNGAQQDAEARRETISAWRAVQDAATQTILPDGTPHPLAHGTRIKVASQLYALGENIEARSELEAGIEGLRPYLAFYPATWMEGLALLGVLMTQDGDGDAAWPLVLEGYEAFLADYRERDPDGTFDGLAMAKSNLEFSLSQIGSRTGRAEESIRFQKVSLDTREKALGPNHPDTIASYYGYAGTLQRAGEMAEAERFARIAVERSVEHVDPAHPTYARSLEMLGIVLSRSGRPIEATDYLVRALDLKREHEGTDNLVFGYGIHNLATILHQRERYDDAAPLFAEAETLFREKQGEDSPYAIGSLAYVGQIDFAQGRPADAVARFGELEMRLGETSSDIDMRRRIAPDYVRSLLEIGETERARTIANAFREGVLAAEELDPFLLRFANTLAARTEMGSEPAEQTAVSEARALVSLLERRGLADLRGAVPSEERNALDLVMEIAVLANDTDLMLSAMALLNASDIAAASAQRVQRESESDPAFAESLRELQEAETAVERADAALLSRLASGGEIAEAREAFSQADARRDKALERLADAFPAWSAIGTRNGQADIAAVSASLDDGEALLAVVPAYANTYVLVVDRKGALAVAADVGRARIVELASALREDTLTGRDASANARDLATAILTDEVRGRLQGVEALRVVAGGALASLPFALLEWPDDTAGGSLIDRFALANASSFAPQTLARSRSQAAMRFVGFADPTPFGSGVVDAGAATPTRGITTFFDRRGPDTAALARLPSLAGSRAEVRDVAALFPADGSTVFLGPEASEGAVLNDAVGVADVLLFATHGLIAGEIEGVAEPALVMAAPVQGTSGDGLLTASEVAALDLSAEWVILSACDSAAGMQGGLPAFSGLAQAFRFAGADALLVTHWQVRDDVAAFVSRETLTRWRLHGDKRRALREAIQALRTESGLPGASDPAVWAPFVLIEG